MNIVNPNQPITSELNTDIIRQLTQRYPGLRSRVLTDTLFGRPVTVLSMGTGPRQVIYTAAHHANEWLTAWILLQFAQDFAQAEEDGSKLYDRDVRELSKQVTIHLVPLVNPDGVDLVTGAIEPDEDAYIFASQIAAGYPEIPFPEGWKADLVGTDLNLNYPAKWLQAREIKFSQGFTCPAPRDYVGRAPLNQPPTQALADFTREVDPALVLAFHSQGKEIYWQFGDIQVPGAEELGQKFAQASGYTLAEPGYSSSFAGYKDWFIQQFRRPGYTIEVGQGQNPLPLSQFPQIYQDNLGILMLAAADS